MRNLHEQIIQSLRSGVIAVDSNGKVVVINDAARAYLQIGPRETLAGRLLGEIANAEALAAIMREALERKLPIDRREITVTLPDGTRELGASATVLRDGDNVEGVVFLFTDLTELHELARAAEMNKRLAALGELTAGVVHELRSPLSVISGAAELLLRKFDPDDPRAKSVATIFDEAAALERTISQFLGFARPFTLRPSNVTIEAIIARARQLCERRSEHKRVKIIEQLSPAIPPVWVDAGQLSQALANILQNAIDAVPENSGQVTVDARLDQDDVCIDISDNGPGVHLRDGDDIFSPFFTLKEGGTGLGLSIVYRIITAHHGSITYANLPDGGVRFSVRLPLVAGPKRA